MIRLFARLRSSRLTAAAVFCLGLAAALLAPATSSAEAWPTKPIKMIVAFSPGGGTDNLARNMATFLQEELGQPVVVENRPGAGALLAHTYFLQQPDDGYAMLATVAMPYMAVQTLTQDVDFTVSDFAFVNLPRNDYTIIATRKDSPIKSVKQLVDEVRTNPGKVSVGVGAPSGADYINMTLFFRALGIDFSDVRIVNYNGGGELRVAVAGGQVDVAFVAGLPSIPQADMMEGLMVFRDNRAKPWDAPAFDEAMADLSATGKTKMVPGALGGFIMHASFREKYPERWDKLVTAFKNIADDPAKVKKLEDQKLWGEWLGPDKSTRMVHSAYEAYEEERSLLKPD